MSTVVTDTSVDYPTGDGKPMAETQVHREVMVLLIEALEDRYAGRTDVYVGANMLMFYERDNKHRHIAPDVFVVLGVSSRVRENYLVWEEAKPTLDLVIEVTSKRRSATISTRRRSCIRTGSACASMFCSIPFRSTCGPHCRCSAWSKEHTRKCPHWRDGFAARCWAWNLNEMASF